MPASKWRTYREFVDDMASKNSAIDLANDTIKMGLFLSTSNCGDVALANALYGTLTNEHAGQYGYTQGGKTVAATWARSGANWVFDVADPAAWTATGGSIVFRYLVLWDDTVANKPLIAYCVADAAPADVTVTDTNTLNVPIDADGVYRMAGAEA